MSRPSIDPEPWERQKGESAKAFEAFAVYRDMPNRSIREVARQLDKSRTIIGRWSSTHEWQKRIAAWDAEQDRIARQAQTEAIKKMRKDHAALANAMLVKAAKALKKIKDDEIKASDLSRLVEVGAKLERISRGDVGDVIEERDGGPSIPTVQFYIPDNHRDNINPEEETTDDNQP